jgi:hypothetical protein
VTVLDAVPRSPAVRLGPRRYPIVLPSLRDPRLHLASVIITLQVLGQTSFGFDLSIAQILVSVLTCAVLEVGIVFRRSGVLAWPASAMLTGNGVAFVLRVPGTEHGDWWSMRGAWIFAATAAVSLLSKYVIRVGGRHLFNPSNFGLVLCFVLLGSSRVEPLDLWWGPMSPALVAALAVIVVGGLAILTRLALLHIATSFWLAFAASLALVAVAGHCITAPWHAGPICDGEFWALLVTSPEILVFLFFMITDPKTIPRGRPAQLAYGIAVALVASLLIAPQRTEFGTKVSVLAALLIVCAARPLIERALPTSGRAWRVPRIAVALGAIAVVGALVAATTPARTNDVDAMGARTASLSGIDVRVNDDRLSSQLSLDTARTVAADTVAALDEQANALRELDRDRALRISLGDWRAHLDQTIRDAGVDGRIVVPEYDVDEVIVSVARRKSQRAAAVLATVHGTVREVTYSGTPPARTTETVEARPVSVTFEMLRLGPMYALATDAPPEGWEAP